MLSAGEKPGVQARSRRHLPLPPGPRRAMRAESEYGRVGTLAYLATAYPNAQMVHLPVHASWLNQVEVYFSVIQRKLLTPDDFDDLHHLAGQILAFEQHYNAQATPFGWRFTRTDLHQLLARIHKHDRFSPLPMAA